MFVGELIEEGELPPMLLVAFMLLVQDRYQLSSKDGLKLSPDLFSPSRVLYIDTSNWLTATTTIFWRQKASC